MPFKLNECSRPIDCREGHVRTVPQAANEFPIVDRQTSERAFSHPRSFGQECLYFNQKFALDCLEEAS